MRKILIINRLGIGDVVLTTPLAQGIKELYTARVGMVVAPKAPDVVTNHPYIDDVFPYRLPSKREMIDRIREKGYEEALIVDGRFSSTMLAIKAGCKPIHPGFEISIGPRRLFTGKRRAESAIVDYTAFLAYLDASKPVPDLPARVGDADEASRKKVADWFAVHQAMAGRLILVIPKGLSENKNWEQAYFSEVTGFLNQKGYIPVYLGAKHDWEYIEGIAGEKVNCAGTFTLRELPLLACKALVCISVCTGPMHVVATTGVPIIALYGPTAPKRWAPRSAQVLQSQRACVPCEKLTCDQSVFRACMQEILPERVVQAIDRILAAGPQEKYEK
ncbi:glycosyltransferase family 9 protein [Sporomusa acidovorans]|uniref:Lipopolysaccharide core heptosyltransferase RfaQ n=1 Tax=Sporomusa acidovorans (strain ATCC 49682 / DSM 3132 / Mol) TaxID=1123286 RepID=A0ABZ3J7Z1_SPOA4|nr:glycosyltransferase family 9 protein [Sporomusa acidovorans]OZC19322.1 ADP-heptose--LPS heptosyltransferase 2 [Sporomusa acidovorans DSM 3132]SDD80824.1 heptosyltransferase-2 [Sporomusa acidovorans]